MTDLRLPVYRLRCSTIAWLAVATPLSTLILGIIGLWIAPKRSLAAGSAVDMLLALVFHWLVC